MNNNIDFDTRKYITLLIIMCAIFVVAIVKAFDYLPQKEEIPNEQVISKEVNTSSQKDDTAADDNKQEQNDANADKDNNDSDEEDTDNDDNNEMEFEEINTPKGANTLKTSDNEKATKAELSSEEKAIKAIFTAKKAVKSGDYKTAIDEYQKVSLLTEDKELVSSSYEGISKIYAINKRFGTALSFALKAYNLNPTLSGEILVAKIYYKTGEIEKATKFVTEMLKRDFTKDK